ncbi:hypothetical protein N7465_009686 [Penicillium sp. CMV-2018d]|nr:hypothetical protein N7465_009686 [Penicillium sp. CMV-2018d]
MIGLALVEAHLDHSVAVGSSEWHPAIVIFRADIGHPRVKEYRQYSLVIDSKIKIGNDRTVIRLSLLSADTKECV